MQYNFSGICNDATWKMSKRMMSINKKLCDDISNALTVINNDEVNERKVELGNVIGDILSDLQAKYNIMYIEALNKVQAELKNYLPLTDY